MSTLAEKLSKLQSEERRYFFQSPFHLMMAQRWERLEQILTDIEFIEAKCSAGDPYNMLEDCNRSLACKTIPAVAAFRQALSLALPAVVSRPEWTMQSLYNRLKWIENLDPRSRKQLRKAEQELHKRGMWISTEGPMPGPTGEGVFSFPFSIPSGIQSVSAEKNSIAIGNFSGKVVIHDIATGKEVKKVSLEKQRIVGALATNMVHTSE